MDMLRRRCMGMLRPHPRRCTVMVCLCSPSTRNRSLFRRDLRLRLHLRLRLRLHLRLHLRLRLRLRLRLHHPPSVSVFQS